MKGDSQTRQAEARIRDLAHRLRRDVEKAIEPKAQALLETSAEVLGGLINAFDEYKTRRNREWEREDASARKAAPKRTAGRRGPRKRAA